jgi:hypothetical protein
MVDPQCVGSEQLRRSWCDPVRQAVVILLCRFNLPAHDQEHDEYYGDLFWSAADVGECAQDVGEELGQRMGVYYTVWIG